MDSKLWIFSFSLLFLKYEKTIPNNSIEQKVMQRKNTVMGLFWGNSKKKKLQSKYESLLKESYKLSKVNRQASDAKIAEAEEVLKQISTLV